MSWHPLPRPLQALPLAGLCACCLLFAGCGTNIKAMLAKQGETVWEADELVEAAEAQGSELLPAVLKAEEERLVNCERIDGAVAERMQKDSLPFWEQLWSDLTLLVSLVAPIPVVERCADAHDVYYEELDRLRDSLRAEAQQSEAHRGFSRSPWPFPQEAERGR